MADIFLSYSDEDKTTVKRIAGLLQKKGWTVWWDTDIAAGQRYDTAIETELKNAACVIVLWTKRSVNSEWVRNEANEALSNNKLIPLMLENAEVPLQFRRVEAVMLADWDREDIHPELDNLFSSVEKIIGRPAPPPQPSSNILRRYIIVAATGVLLLAAFLFCYFRFINDESNYAPSLFYSLIILGGIAAGTIVYGGLNVYTIPRAGRPLPKFRIYGFAAGALMIAACVLLMSPASPEKNIMVRLFDWKKNPVTQGDVKIYLKEYVRTQSVDKVGQALFTGLPPEMFSQKIKIDVSSPGFVSLNLDTLVSASKPLELTMPFSSVVFISGRIKTAAEMPIAGVEINAEGTRYYAVSLTDGSYRLRLEEYTLGDDISLTTSHKNFDDKTISFKIESPEMTGKDIVLNPLH